MLHISWTALMDPVDCLLSLGTGLKFCTDPPPPWVHQWSWVRVVDFDPWQMLRVRVGSRKTGLSPPSVIFYWPVLLLWFIFICYRIYNVCLLHDDCVATLRLSALPSALYFVMSKPALYKVKRQSMIRNWYNQIPQVRFLNLSTSVLFVSLLLTLSLFTCCKPDIVNKAGKLMSALSAIVLQFMCISKTLII